MIAMKIDDDDAKVDLGTVTVELNHDDFALVLALLRALGTSPFLDIADRMEAQRAQQEAQEAAELQWPIDLQNSMATKP